MLLLMQVTDVFQEAHYQLYMTHDILKVMISNVKITDNFSSGGMLIDGSAGVDDHLQCVSKKNIPDIFSCNSRKHCRIFIIFGTHVTKKVGNQQML